MKDFNQPAWSTVWNGSPTALIPVTGETVSNANELSKEVAREKLIGILKNAYSGELGAIHAYKGHQKSVCDPAEKRMIYCIEMEEIYHRERVGEILMMLGEGPSIHQDATMGWVGKILGRLCSWSGWLAPMYGAGLLESRNIKEYIEAADYALAAGHVEILDDLLTMAEVEWEHEKYFREKCSTHYLYRWFPKWPIPPVKETIRTPFLGVDYPEGQLGHIMDAEIHALRG